MSEPLVAGRVEDIPPGTRLILPHGQHGIGVFNVNGTFAALNNYCPHAGAPVCVGKVTGTTRAEGPYELTWEHEGEILRCPWHGWEFWLHNGKAVVGKPRAIKSYPVRVEDGLVIVDV